MDSEIFFCSSVSEKSIRRLVYGTGSLHLRDLGVVEAELDQDLARVLAEVGGAGAERAAAAAVCPDGEGGEAGADGFSLPELRVRHRRLGGRGAEVDRDVVRL